MKTFLLAITVLLPYFPVSWGCGQGIVANYHFKNVAENPNFDDATRHWANQTYWHMEEIRRRRKSAQMGGEGISEQGGDDQDFNQEQNPSDAAALRAEEQALETHDKDNPQPALEPENPPTPQETGNQHSKRRFTPDEMYDSIERIPRSSLARRQGFVLQRFLYTDLNTCFTQPPYALVRTERSAPAVDQEVNLVFQGIGSTHLLYRNIFGRQSLLMAGGVIHGTARYCDRLPNAFWDGRQTLFGDGDGVLFNIGSFTRSLSVVGHEVTHGIIQYTNPLMYKGQSGALNEHLSDVFGVLASMYTFGFNSANFAWTVGPGLPVGGGALRSFAAPGTAYNTRALGKDRQVATMADYFPGPEDDFGVHINSGIPNHAFYLFSIAVGGHAYNIPGKIWYNVLTQGQGKFDEAGETFASFAQRTLRAANQLYGTATANQLHRAWRDVGVL